VRALLRRIFVENLGLKIVSLVLAITVFVLVRGEKDAQSGSFVKVIYSYPSDRVLVTDTPDRVRLLVRGPWTRINRFKERDLDPIRVDLGTAASGEFKFQDDMIKLPQGVRVVSFNPPSVKLEFEPRVTRAIPVAPSLEGAPAAGYKVEGTEVEPSDASVTGAQSVLATITHVGTDLVRISGAHGSVTRVVSLARLPRHAEFVDDAKVRVSIRIVPELGERVVTRVAVQAVGGPAPVRIDPATVDVVVKGPRTAIDALTPASIVPSVDVRDLGAGMPGSYIRPVTVGGLVDGLSADARPGSVRVTVARRAAPAPQQERP
jgi:YbbR domain-containing protein